MVTSISNVKEWPLQFRRLPDFNTGISAMSVGGGWAKFISDQHLGVGAFLTFEVVDERRLVVALHERSALEDFQPLQQQRVVEPTEVRECSDREPPPVDNTDPVHSHLPVLPKVLGDDRPQFQKTLRKTHMKKHDCSILVRP